jgi:hypothetical protein
VAEGSIEKGQRLCRKQRRFSDAAGAGSGGAAAERALVWSMLIEGRPCVAKDFKRAFESLLLLERRWAVRAARVYSAAATFEAMVLPKMRSELRREREEMGSCFMQIVVGSATMRDGASWKSTPRLCNSTKKILPPCSSVLHMLRSMRKNWRLGSARGRVFS